MATLINRLEMLMEEKGWDHADLMRISGQSSSVVSQWLGKGSKVIKTIGKQEAAEALARESGYSALWIAKGIGPKTDTNRRSGVPGGSAIRGIAHDMSQARNTESLPRMRWEELMTADLAWPFELEVIDDALAPEIFKGCIALLDPKRPPEPGWPVLVRDSQGHHYLRDYKVGAGSRWGAVPRAAQKEHFDPLDSEAHGLVIIAAMDGYKRPQRAQGGM